MFSRLISIALLACCTAIGGLVPPAQAQTHVGLANPSFESPLDPAADWTPMIVPASGGYPGGYPGSDPLFDPTNACPDPTSDAHSRRRVCVVGTDSFQVTEGGSTRTETVTPLHGAKM